MKMVKQLVILLLGKIYSKNNFVRVGKVLVGDKTQDVRVVSILSI
jgi:hypothetical protein